MNTSLNYSLIHKDLLDILYSEYLDKGFRIFADDAINGKCESGAAAIISQDLE